MYLQNSANNGKLGIVTAKNKKGHGHIQVVVPETDDHTAEWNDAHTKVIVPLFSQAGASNFKYGNIGRWWERENYINDGFYIHD